MRLGFTPSSSSSSGASMRPSLSPEASLSMGCPHRTMGARGRVYHHAVLAARHGACESGMLVAHTSIASRVTGEVGMGDAASRQFNGVQNTDVVDTPTHPCWIA